MSNTYYNQIPTLQDQLADLQQRMKTTETAPRLASSAIGSGGLTVNDGGSITIRDGGYLEIVDGGTLSVSGNTSIGGTLTVGANTTISGTLGVTGRTTLGGNTTVSGTLGVTGTTTLGGPTSITGDLTLRDGSIQGDALASQISASNTRATNSGWAAPSGTWTQTARATASRPSWATQAMIIAVGTATGRTAALGSGTDSPLRIRMNVNGSASTEVIAVLSDSGSGTLFQATGTVAWSDVINSPGSTVYAQVEVSSYRSVWWPAQAGSTASVSMQVLWLR